MTQPPSPLATPVAWNRVADDYAADIVPHFEKYAADALRLAGVAPGARVLDEAAQVRERIHVHRDSPVSEGAPPRQPHQAVLLRRDALLCDRGSQHVTQQRLPRRGRVRTGARRCV
ncbi:hypothetical protein [Sorangium sp. So ce1153]|uniref:hypothetical protein n=1 Tax=Sorangium sp. So ce1153 TaxID=3133333 RepID=UPI003F5D96D0